MNISSFKTAIGYWKTILLPGGIVGVGVVSVVCVWVFLMDYFMIIDVMIWQK